MKDRLLYFDGLRGLAAFVVVIHHYELGFMFRDFMPEGFFKTALASEPGNILYNGKLAVYLFFIMSGYVLSFPFFKSGKNEFLIASATKRYFRLEIPVFASIMVSYLLLKFHMYKHFDLLAVTHSKWLEIFWKKDANIFIAVYDALYHSMFINKGFYNAPVLWTMSMELYGSLALFAFLALFGKIRHRRFLYIPMFFLLVKTPYIAFLFGLVLSDFTVNGIQVKFRELWALLAFVVYAAVVMLPESIRSKLLMVNDIEMVYSLLIIVALLLSTYLQKLFETPVFAFLGKISFSMYLLHPLLLASFSAWLYLYLLPYNYGAFNTFLIVFGVSVPVLLGISYLFYYLIDKNGMKWANKIYEKVFKAEIQQTPVQP